MSIPPHKNPFLKQQIHFFFFFTYPATTEIYTRPYTLSLHDALPILLQGPDGPAEDSIPEDASVVVDTKDGLVIITGCGHAGVVNTAEYARSFLRPAPVHAVIGGLHLFAATDAQVAWTAGKLRELGVAYLLGAHCTGIEATYRLREIIGLTRKTAVVGAVGASFTLGKGLDPLGLAG